MRKYEIAEAEKCAEFQFYIYFCCIFRNLLQIPKLHGIVMNPIGLTYQIKGHSPSGFPCRMLMYVLNKRIVVFGSQDFFKTHFRHIQHYCTVNFSSLLYCTLTVEKVCFSAPIILSKLLIPASGVSAS